jgi:hypothetical protein
MNRIITIAARHWKPLLLFNAIFVAVTTAWMTTTPQMGTANAELTVSGPMPNLRETLNKQNTQQQQSARLTRDKLDQAGQNNQAKDSYNAGVPRMQADRLNAVATYSTMQVPASAQGDEELIHWRRFSILLGLGLVAMLSNVGLGLLLENRNPLLRPADLQKLNASVLGSITQIKHFNPEVPMGLQPMEEFHRLVLAISVMHLAQSREAPRYTASVSVG